MHTVYSFFLEPSYVEINDQGVDVIIQYQHNGSACYQNDYRIVREAYASEEQLSETEESQAQQCCEKEHLDSNLCNGIRDLLDKIFHNTVIAEQADVRDDGKLTRDNDKTQDRSCQIKKNASAETCLQNHNSRKKRAEREQSQLNAGNEGSGIYEYNSKGETYPAQCQLECFSSFQFEIFPFLII